MALRLKRRDKGQPAGSVRARSVCLIGPAASPLEFSRFLLSSAGLHLVLAWAVMTTGLHRPAVSEKPLVVRLVEAETPRLSPTPAPSVRARTKQVASQSATEPAGPKEIAQPGPTLLTVAHPELAQPRTVDITNQTAQDERHEILSQRATEGLVKDLGLTAWIPPVGPQNASGEGISGPRSVGAPSKVAIVPGAVAGKGLDSGASLVREGSGVIGPRGSRADAGKGPLNDLMLPPPRPVGSSIGRAGGVGGPRATAGGAAVATPSGGRSSGPVLLGGGGGEVGPGRAGREGGARRLGAALAAPLAPTVTIGPRQSAGGRAVDGAGNGATAGKFAAPNYGTNPLPKYPPLAREKGYEGTVYLRVLVQADGRVGRLAIGRSSGHEILDRAAVDSVKEWTFLPAHKGGKSVQSWVLLPVKFMLD